MKTHHGSTTVRWLFIINLRLVFECCWKYFPPHDQAYYCSQYMNCLLHILAFMGLSFTTFERLDQEFITFERLPAQAAFTISNLQSKIAFRISLLLLLEIYYIWADAWARPVVTKFNGILKLHFYKSEYLRQKASNSNILKMTNKQWFWHWKIIFEIFSQ